jgi:hypothetical protein
MRRLRRERKRDAIYPCYSGLARGGDELHKFQVERHFALNTANE